MTYYIYPSRTNGKAIYNAITVLDQNVKCILIDDKDSIFNFQYLYTHYTAGDIVLIASKWNYEYFEKKIKDADIKSYKNGIKWLGNRINLEIQKKRIQNKKAIGIVMQHDMIVKNFCEVDKDLYQKGYEIVYFTSMKSLYKKLSKRHQCFLVGDAILEEINAVDMMIVACGEPIHKDVMSLNLTHGCQGTLHYPFADYTEQDKQFLKYAFLRNTYVASSCVKVTRGYKEFLKYFGIQSQNDKIVDVGYMHLSKAYYDYEKYVRLKKNDVDTILFAFSFLKPDDRVVEMVKDLLESNKKVYVMPHPLFKDEVLRDFYPIFHDNDNFLREDSFKSRNEIFARSICVVTDSSSVGYTFPLITKKPAIVYTEDKEEYWSKKWGNEHYFDEKLHRLCSDAKELLAIVRDIPNKQKEYEEQIEIYRKNECHYFYNSRKKTIEFICDLLK